MENKFKEFQELARDLKADIDFKNITENDLKNLELFIEDIIKGEITTN